MKKLIYCFDLDNVLCKSFVKYFQCIYFYYNLSSIVESEHLVLECVPQFVLDSQSKSGDAMNSMLCMMKMVKASNKECR